MSISIENLIPQTGISLTSKLEKLQNLAEDIKNEINGKYIDTS